MLERSKVGILEPKDGNGISAKYVTTPGEASPSGTCPIPRKEMEAFSLPPSAPARKPGVIVLMSATVWMVLRASASAEQALTETGTSRSRSSRRRAATTNYRDLMGRSSYKTSRTEG